MKTFTLEWNAVITLETEGRAGRESLKQLVSMHERQIDVGIVTTAASENTAARELPASGIEFDLRLNQVGLQKLTRVFTITCINLTYYGYSSIAPNDCKEVLLNLWEIVQPGSLPYSHFEFAQARGFPNSLPISAPPFQKWRNKWCDVHSLYAHILSRRDVFVSGDVKNFRGERSKRLRDLGVTEICSYDEALEIALGRS